MTKAQTVTGAVIAAIIALWLIGNGGSLLIVGWVFLALVVAASVFLLRRSR